MASSDVIVLLKLRHYVMSISAYLGTSGAFLQYEIRYSVMVRKKKNTLIVLGLDRKICPSGSPFVITRQGS